MSLELENEDVSEVIAPYVLDAEIDGRDFFLYLQRDAHLGTADEYTELHADAEIDMGLYLEDKETQTEKQPKATGLERDGSGSTSLTLLQRFCLSSICFESRELVRAAKR